MHTYVHVQCQAHTHTNMYTHTHLNPNLMDNLMRQWTTKEIKMSDVSFVV